MATFFGIDRWVVGLFGGACQVEVGNLVDPARGLGPIGVTLAVFACTRVLLARVSRTVDEAHRLGELSAERRRKGIRLRLVKPDVT